MYLSSIAILLTVTLLLPIPLPAQSFGAPRVAEPGDSIRVMGTDYVTQHGAFLRSHASSVTLMADGHEVRLEPESIRGVERYREPNRFLKFAVPTIIGAGAGSAIGALSWSPCTATGFLGCVLHPSSRSEQALLVGSITGLIGGVVGLVRAARAKPGWEDVVVPHTAGEFTIAPTPVGSLGFGFRIPRT